MNDTIKKLWEMTGQRFTALVITGIEDDNGEETDGEETLPIYSEQVSTEVRGLAEVERMSTVEVWARLLAGESFRPHRRRRATWKLV